MCQFWGRFILMNCSVSICKNLINIILPATGRSGLSASVDSFGKKSGHALKTHFLQSLINKSSEIWFPIERGILNHFDKEPKLGLKKAGGGREARSL